MAVYIGIYSPAILFAISNGNGQRQCSDIDLISQSKATMLHLVLIIAPSATFLCSLINNCLLLLLLHFTFVIGFCNSSTSCFASPLCFSSATSIFNYHRLARQIPAANAEIISNNLYAFPLVARHFSAVCFVLFFCSIANLKTDTKKTVSATTLWLLFSSHVLQQLSCNKICKKMCNKMLQQGKGEILLMHIYLCTYVYTEVEKLIFPFDIHNISFLSARKLQQIYLEPMSIPIPATALL